MNKLQRSELLFLYDVRNANPNGDPVDENKPRVDGETGINIVTDVRFKRTIRDYFLTLIENGDERLKGQDIFIKEVRDSEGYLYDAKTRAKDFLEKKEGKFSEMRELIKKDICSKCIDVRLFGAVIPLELKVEGKEKPETGSITLTGPVQFKFGSSLHRVKIEFIKGTGAFASDYETEEERKIKLTQGKKISSSTQFTFREEYILPYSLISFYGIINENSAKETGLTPEDITLLLEAMWNGTKNLITRTKAGQIPRLLMQIVYKEPNFHIGGLDDLRIEKGDLPDEKIRDISEIKLDVTKLSKKLNTHKGKIDRIRYSIDEDLKLFKNGRDITVSELFPQDIFVERISF